MHITRVAVYKADIPLVAPFRIALGVTEVAENFFVKIETDEGVCGWGEGSPFPAIVGETQATCLAAARDMARLLIGKDPLDIEARLGELSSFLPHNTTARSAFDMALYDILGKAAELPLFRLFGGSPRDLYTDDTIGIDSPENMAEKARTLKEKGFRAIKVKLGTAPAEDIERVRRVREAIGPGIPIRVDANQGWDLPAAVTVLTSIEGLGVQYCEQPVAAGDLEGMREVREKTRIPIMADESLFDLYDALDLIKMGACDYFNIKLSKSGGLHMATKIAAVAEAARLGCMVGCMSETRLALTAAAHLAAARPVIRFLDLDSALTHTVDPILGGMEYREGGRIELPAGPGLGAEVDPAFLEKLESFTVSSP
ncbi:dipeptide epimerase [Candidatus Bipolaricaulota bacterium]|nr:dipeptide epimerase [Candidatus Bipolaricaulota bacterium]